MGKLWHRKKLRSGMRRENVPGFGPAGNSTKQPVSRITMKDQIHLVTMTICNYPHDMVNQEDGRSILKVTPL